MFGVDPFRKYRRGFRAKVRLFICLMLGTFSHAIAEEIKLQTIEIDGRSYTNARISSYTKSDAFIFYDGGGGRFPIGKLPQDIQKKLGYDPVAAADYKAKEEKTRSESLKKQAELQALVKAVDAMRLEPKRMQLLNVSGTPGFERCLVQIDGEGRKEIFTSAPQAAKKHLSEINALDQKIKSLKPQIDKQVAEAELAHKNAPISCSGTVAFVAQCDAERRRANQMMSDAEEAQRKFHELELQLTELKNEATVSCAFWASQTPRKYAGLEVWEYVGTSKPVEKGTMFSVPADSTNSTIPPR